ncbi:hypothetical protein FB45DRAFT_1007617 [Roridomyces roridus]|uniref:Uncharacterized protein n=1 Tax=Roridomyces roridus TaxID=1738132 RepID=A0AAD7BE22_9AGAR|nr:hypothetical protein FB45DRAFT_1007617 [Roridomyces roridus]
MSPLLRTIPPRALDEPSFRSWLGSLDSVLSVYSLPFLHDTCPVLFNLNSKDQRDLPCSIPASFWDVDLRTILVFYSESAVEFGLQHTNSWIGTLPCLPDEASLPCFSFSFKPPVGFGDALVWRLRVWVHSHASPSPYDLEISGLGSRTFRCSSTPNEHLWLPQSSIQFPDTNEAQNKSVVLYFMECIPCLDESTLQHRQNLSPPALTFKVMFIQILFCGMSSFPWHVGQRTDTNEAQNKKISVITASGLCGRPELTDWFSSLALCASDEYVGIAAGMLDHAQDSLTLASLRSCVVDPQRLFQVIR